MRSCGWLLALILLGGCRKSATTLASVEKPVKAELVTVSGEEVHVPTGGGRGSIGAPELRHVEGTSLRLHVGTRPRDVSLSDQKWTTGELVEDAEGRRFAYRESKGSWRWVHLAGSGQAWKGKGEIEATAIEWAKVPTLEAEAAKMYDSIPEADRSALLAEVKKRGGEAAVVRLLVDTAGVPCDTAHGERPWLDLLHGLPPAERADVHRKLLPRLSDPSIPLEKLDRVVDALDAGAPEIADAIAIRLRALPLAAPHEGERAAAVLLRGLTRGNKTLAADVGCAILGRVVDRDGKVGKAAQHLESRRQHLVEAALVAVAHARAKCPAASALYTTQPCDSTLRCGRVADDDPPDGGAKEESELPLCTEAELLRETDELVTSKEDRDEYPLVVHVDNHFPRRALAVAWAARAVSPDVARANLRRTYAVSGASSTCSRSTLREAACGLPAAKSADVAGSCAFTIDDRARRITARPTVTPP